MEQSNIRCKYTLKWSCCSKYAADVKYLQPPVLVWYETTRQNIKLLRSLKNTNATYKCIWYV